MSMKHASPETCEHLRRALIDAHYDTPLDLGQISGAAGFSPYHVTAR